MRADFEMLYQATNRDQAFDILSILKAHEIDFIINDNELNLMAIETKIGDFNRIYLSSADLERASALIPSISEEDESYDDPAYEENIEEMLSGSNRRNAYYEAVFKRYDDNDGKFFPIWNSFAFLFSIWWYISKGMWVLALAISLSLSLFVGLIEFFTPIPGPLLTILFALYAGFRGNYDYYLYSTKGKVL